MFKVEIVQASAACECRVSNRVNTGSKVILNAISNLHISHAEVGIKEVRTGCDHEVSGCALCALQNSFLEIVRVEFAASKLLIKRVTVVGSLVTRDELITR